MLQLGDFQFAVSTASYQELTRSTSWRWPGQDRLGQAAALQYTGPGDDTIRLQGVIYPEWRGGFGQVDSLRALGGAGKPLMLVSGLGDVFGAYVIEQVDERQGVFAAAGQPRRQEFSVALRRFGDTTNAL